jgi:hypothetical protein
MFYLELLKVIISIGFCLVLIIERPDNKIEKISPIKINACQIHNNTSLKPINYDLGF